MSMGIFKGFTHFMQKGTIRQQMYKAYFAIGLVPITLIGVFLLYNSYSMINTSNRDLLESYNQRVATTLFEITTQTYNIAGKLTYDTNLWHALSRPYPDLETEQEAIDQINVVDDYNYDYTAIESITVYCDNPYLQDYQQFVYADQEIQNQEWYVKAKWQQAAFWQSLTREDEFGQTYYNMALVQRIPLVESDYHAVLVIRLSDNYLKTRLKESQYRVAIAIEEEPISFSSVSELYGRSIQEWIPSEEMDEYYRYQGTITVEEEKSMAYCGAMSPYRAESRFNICTWNPEAYSSIRNLIFTCVIILLIALLLPLFSILYFTGYFSRRILALRDAMHQVRGGDYDLPQSLQGEDEVSEAFSDLVDTVTQIQEQNAQIYEAQLAEKELKNKQQEMEYAVLAGQINPHFLYNTLETIRMKAFTAGDREVAGAVKTLGKIMRYVLDNSNKQSVELASCLTYIENYLSLQKLRFGDRIDYEIRIGEGVDPEKTKVIPLLIQPLAENALLHGLDEKEEGGRILIDIQKCSLDRESQVRNAAGSGEETETGKTHALKIVVQDNGVGLTEQELQNLRDSLEGNRQEEGRKRVGLSNIASRIRISYGPPYGLFLDSKAGEGTIVTLLLPFDSTI